MKLIELEDKLIKNVWWKLPLVPDNVMIDIDSRACDYDVAYRAIAESILEELL